MSDLGKWKEIESYVLNEGVDRYLAALNDLPELEFIKHYQALAEFFRPKIQRATLSEIETKDELEGVQVTIVRNVDRPKGERAVRRNVPIGEEDNGSPRRELEQ